MPWQGIDFLGISLSDDTLANKLDAFLKDRSEHLACALMQLFPPLLKRRNESAQEVLKRTQEGESEPLTVLLVSQLTAEREAIVGFFSSQPVEWEAAYRQLKNLLWEQVELLEGSVRELYFQQSNVGIDRWNQELLKAVEGFQKVLLLHIDSFKEFLNELQKPLASISDELRRFDKTPWWKNLLFFTAKNHLCKTLIGHLDKCKEYLDSKHTNFISRFDQYQKLAEEVDEKAKKLDQYEILASLGEKFIETYRSLYRLLKLWKRFSRYKSYPKQEIERAFFTISRNKCLQLISLYYKALEKMLFDKSRTIKTTPKQLFADKHARSFVLEILHGYRKELHTLGALVFDYRDYLVSSDPNPYVRSRWGYGNTPVASEPGYSTQLTELGFSIEQLDSLYDTFIKAFEEGPADDEEKVLHDADEEIQQYLHEISQPLIPESLFRSRVDKVLQNVDALDELGSFGREIVDYVKTVLSRLLRADWRGHYLHDIPSFEKSYQLHHNIVGPSVDRSHEQRLQKLHQLQQELLVQIKKDNKSGYEEENESDYHINDIKGYLQDFLATVQRSLQNNTMGLRRARRHVEEVAQQLLEYRYLFGKFFSELIQTREGRYLRTQFLFVAHYFETIENKIYEFKVQKGLIEEELSSSAAEEASSEP